MASRNRGAFLLTVCPSRKPESTENPASDRIDYDPADHLPQTFAGLAELGHDLLLGSGGTHRIPQRKVPNSIPAGPLLLS